MANVLSVIDERVHPRAWYGTLGVLLSLSLLASLALTPSDTLAVLRHFDAMRSRSLEAQPVRGGLIFRLCVR